MTLIAFFSPPQCEQICQKGDILNIQLSAARWPISISVEDGTDRVVHLFKLTIMKVTN